jgi:hypothetical protein
MMTIYDLECGNYKSLSAAEAGQASAPEGGGWCGVMRALVSDDNIQLCPISSCQETYLQGMRQRSYASAAAVYLSH